MRNFLQWKHKQLLLDLMGETRWPRTCSGCEKQTIFVFTGKIIVDEKNQKFLLWKCEEEWCDIGYLERIGPFVRN